MNGSTGNAGGGEVFDAVDRMLLDEIREVLTVLDPMPDDLLARIRFAFELEDLDVEVSRLTRPAALTRDGATDDENRTITFDSSDLTIMITIAMDDAETVRLDGWLAPPGAHRIELRTATGDLSTTADDTGRFVVVRVPRGLCQLIVHPADGATPTLARPVATPAIVV